MIKFRNLHAVVLVAISSTALKSAAGCTDAGLLYTYHKIVSKNSDLTNRFMTQKLIESWRQDCKTLGSSLTDGYFYVCCNDCTVNNTVDIEK